jgi:cytochrome c
MNKLIFFLAVIVLLQACDSKEYKRPRDPWVFRSVLDKQPRIVTATLNEELFVAYDARYCGLYKAWKGKVILDGPVYTTTHGPQPTTDGYAYFEQRLQEPAWRLIVDGTESTPKAQFKGHFFKDGQVTFRFHLSDEAGHAADIEETPEYITKSGKNGLQRHFVVKNLSANTAVALKTSLTNLEKENDFETDGKIATETTVKNEYPNGTTLSVPVVLTLNSDKATDLKVYYHKGFEIPKAEARTAQTELQEGAALIEGSDCKTCHNEGKKTIGPAYIDVAKKYDFTKSNVSNLVDKVIKGGTGVWGDVAMTAHPDLKVEDATKMVNYIMSLDGQTMEVENKGTDLNLNVSSITFPLTDKNEYEKEEDGKDYPGLAVMLFKIDPDMPINDIPEKSKPILNGIAPAVHFVGDQLDNLGTLKSSVYLQFNGFITIAEEGNYVFRLISDDGSSLYIDGKQIVDNDGFHSTRARDGEVILKKGKHPIKVNFYEGGGGYSLSLQWAKHGDNKFSIVPNSILSHGKKNSRKTAPYVEPSLIVKGVPGDRVTEIGVHPAFDIAQARPSSFEPKVGGMDFMSDSSLIICTWDSVGPVYRLEGVTRSNPEKIKVTRIATGLAEPLGIKVVNDTIYVLQKQELTRLIDTDKDGIIDDYQTVCAGWDVSANFHEFAFGLAYKDGYFYATLATAIEPGGASGINQIKDRGKVIKMSRNTGSIEFIASGLRTPNGIGIGVDGELFVADNQGDWLPSSKIVHVKQGEWYGSRSVDFEGTADKKETLPVVWLPQDEIGNSPSQPAYLNVGPYKGQQIHGEVTNGGLKRVFVEKVNGEYQGAVFRFSQGLEGGVNRIVWGPDGSLYVGMIGNPGNWSHAGGKWFGLQRLTYNGKSVFEMLAVRAKSNGVEIEFTEPLGERYGNSIEDYDIQQWYYKPTQDYGGPKLGLEKLDVKSVNLSADRKKVFLELKGMQPNHVVYVHLSGVFMTDRDASLWSTEAWYTLNQIPANDEGFKAPAKQVANNTLTDAEKAAGWVSLFDGKTTAGWHTFKEPVGKIGRAWKVKDGSLMLDASNKKDWQTGDGGDIISDKEYENYELYVEWKIANCGNSGIIINSIDDGKHDYMWQTGPEMQVLDDSCHPDGVYPKHRAGDLYDLKSRSFVAANPAMQWNYVRIVSNKGKYEFWQNGFKIVEFEMHNDDWKKLINESKFKDMPDFGKAKKGHIGLQDHGDNVWFRNIRIREIK